MKKIILPTDGSENAVRAGRFAAELALEEGAEVLVVSVAEPAAYPGFEDTAVTAAIRDFASSMADQEAGRLRAAGVPVETLVVESEQAYDGILQAAAECNADMIVMGTHGRGALARALIGSVADKIVRHASIPVLLVPSTTHTDTQGESA
jgi:nucleotide-binding universal stress UspA family protein